MTVPDDFIIDCSEVPSVERFEREIFTIDLCSDGYTSRKFRDGIRRL